jgi:hypothetical protein
MVQAAATSAAPTAATSAAPGAITLAAPTGVTLAAPGCGHIGRSVTVQARPFLQPDPEGGVKMRSGGAGGQGSRDGPRETNADVASSH